MKVISRKIIEAFVKKHPDGKSSIESWYHEAKNNTWKTPSDIKKKYSTASFLKEHCVIFNISGNKYRLVVRVNYDFELLKITWIGTHAEYSKQKFP